MIYINNSAMVTTNGIVIADNMVVIVNISAASTEFFSNFIENNILVAADGAPAIIIAIM